MFYQFLPINLSFKKNLNRGKKNKILSKNIIIRELLQKNTHFITVHSNT